ncbi:hypothetical protein [Pulveribacter sp.]|uniref:hypothetical protein n=1 Tax=Pulveribacter sp. TaxID=2678893 RepID=UPI0028A74030|nr:hypothetical protein [Pulveribacter sp.]
MAAEPFQSWTCDVCGQQIKKAEDGYVTWTDDEKGIRDILVIHKGQCDDGERHLSSALVDFLGADGLARLTAMMSYGPLKNNEACRIHNLAEFTDFMRRMQLPFYEEARPKFLNRSVVDDFHDANEIAPYLPETLKRISEYPED